MKNKVSRQKSFPWLHFLRFDLNFLHTSRFNAFVFVYKILRLYLSAFFIYSSFKYVKSEVNFRDFSLCFFFIWYVLLSSHAWLFKNVWILLPSIESFSLIAIVKWIYNSFAINKLFLCIYNSNNTSRISTI